jgi:hypothetical protein
MWLSSASVTDVGGCSRATYIQEPVIRLGDATVRIHDIAHVFQDGFLDDSIFENDRETCMGR